MQPAEMAAQHRGALGRTRAVCPELKWRARREAGTGGSSSFAAAARCARAVLSWAAPPPPPPAAEGVWQAGVRGGGVCHLRHHAVHQAGGVHGVRGQRLWRGGHAAGGGGGGECAAISALAPPERPRRVAGCCSCTRSVPGAPAGRRAASCFWVFSHPIQPTFSPPLTHATPITTSLPTGFPDPAPPSPPCPSPLCRASALRCPRRPS